MRAKRVCVGLVRRRLVTDFSVRTLRTLVAVRCHATDMYAIIKATEKLERAYVRDAISPDAYEQACGRLIAQFKVLWGSLKSQVGNEGGAGHCVSGRLSDTQAVQPIACLPRGIVHSSAQAVVGHVCPSIHPPCCRSLTWSAS